MPLVQHIQRVDKRMSYTGRDQNRLKLQISIVSHIRYCKIKNRAFIRCRSYPNFTTNKLNICFGYRESDPCAFMKPGHRIIYLVETIKDQVLYLFIDPDTRIGNKEFYKRILYGISESYLSVQGELKSIIQKI